MISPMRRTCAHLLSALYSPRGRTVRPPHSKRALTGSKSCPLSSIHHGYALPFSSWRSSALTPQVESRQALRLSQFVWQAAAGTWSWGGQRSNRQQGYLRSWSSTAWRQAWTLKKTDDRGQTKTWRWSSETQLVIREYASCWWQTVAAYHRRPQNIPELSDIFLLVHKILWPFCKKLNQIKRKMLSNYKILQNLQNRRAAISLYR